MPCRTKEEQREYQRNWIKKRRQEWLAIHGPCKDCRTTERLEVHHRDPAQKVTHNVWSFRIELREAELKKCDVLCRACHRKRTSEQQRNKPRIIKHGTIGAYRGGCKCEICRLYFSGKRKSYPSRQPVHIQRGERRRKGK